MAAVSRNALCPCGSGKKYKRCCGKDEVVSIDSLIDRELVECMHDVLLFASERYEDEIVEVIAERPLEDRPEVLDSAVSLFVTNWVIFCRPVDEKGTTIFSAYMRDRRYARWRPAVQAHVARWAGTVPSFDEIIHFDEERRQLLVRDLLSGKKSASTCWRRRNGRKWKKAMCCSDVLCRTTRRLHIFPQCFRC